MTAEERKIIWQGKSGTNYEYWIFQIGVAFEAAAGNFIFAQETSPHKWKPVYIGQTKNLKDITENLPLLNRSDITHIHAHINTDEASRLAEEVDLIDKWSAHVNTR